MGIADPWHEAIARDVQERIDGIDRSLRWCVEGGATPTPEFIDAIVQRCAEALGSDPLVADFVGLVHGIADDRTVEAFTAHGATAAARRWAELGDRLHALTGTDAVDG